MRLRPADVAKSLVPNSGSGIGSNARRCESRLLQGDEPIPVDVEEVPFFASCKGPLVVRSSAEQLGPAVDGVAQRGSVGKKPPGLGAAKLEDIWFFVIDFHCLGLRWDTRANSDAEFAAVRELGLRHSLSRQWNRSSTLRRKER